MTGLRRRGISGPRYKAGAKAPHTGLYVVTGSRGGVVTWCSPRRVEAGKPLPPLPKPGLWWTEVPE